VGKIALAPLLLAAACLFAGLYGAVHDQVSYTVSPDYYRAYKFPQFGIPPELHDRLGAALVGWDASWWMGLFIGLPLVIVGSILPDWRAYVTRTLASFGVAACTALVVGLAALAWAGWTITDANLPDISFPDGVVDKVAFARAGTVHDFSYLGGFLGILTGTAYLVVERVGLRRRRLLPAGTA
jgi:hypothetical protein